MNAPSQGKQSIFISRDCENLAANVRAPAVTLATNPKYAVGQYAVALGSANNNLTATRTCQVNQRKRMAR